MTRESGADWREHTGNAEVDDDALETDAGHDDVLVVVLASDGGTADDAVLDGDALGKVGLGDEGATVSSGAGDLLHGSALLEDDFGLRAGNIRGEDGDCQQEEGKDERLCNHGEYRRSLTELGRYTQKK